jgi:membrane dipeptidase
VLLFGVMAGSGLGTRAGTAGCASRGAMGNVRAMRTILALLLGTAVAAPLHAQTDSALIRRALRLHRAVPMMDGHNDLAENVAYRYHDSWDSLDIRQSQPSMMTDIPRLRAGGVGGQFFSVWVAPQVAAQRGALRSALEQIDIIQQMEARYPDVFEAAGTADDIVRIHRSGRIAALIGVEGGHSIENSLSVLRMLYRLGARYMTLTWNNGLAWADAQSDTVRAHGLSPFGREVVREMNRLGMLVDLAHVADSTMVEAMRVSAAPVIFSHSSARALSPVLRNVPDPILRMVRENGGIVMINFECGFLDSVAMGNEVEQRAQLRELRVRYGADTAGLRGAVQALRQANTHVTPLSLAADHIDHIRDVAGIDHVGYGSDFDGIGCTPEGLSDVSMFPRLTAELLRRGYSDGDVKKVIGLNLLRVMRQVETVAARLQRERGPSIATLAELDSAAARPR